MPKKLNQEDVEQKLNNFGFKLLDNYINLTTKTKLLCNKCNKVYYASIGTILHGHIRSCGCRKNIRSRRKKFIDFTGLRFDKLIVNKFLYSKKSVDYWECVCDCGNIVIKSDKCLKVQTIKGCRYCTARKYKNHQSWKGYNDIPLSYINSIKSGAKSRNIEFNVTIEYLSSLFINQNKKCALSGLDICFRPIQTSSIDRINSQYGYINGNIQWVHKTINFMKNSLDESRFLYLCKLVTQNN